MLLEVNAQHHVSAHLFRDVNRDILQQTTIGENMIV